MAAVCERPGCPEPVDEGGVHGYCTTHATDALVEEVRALGHNVMRLMEHLDEVAKEIRKTNSLLTDIGKHKGAFY